MDTQVNRPWNTPSVCNVAGALSWQASRQPEAIAVHYPAGRSGRYATCTYDELETLSNAYAAGFARLGIVPGTRTAVMLPPGLDFIAVFFALFKAAAVPVLIDPGIGLGPLKQCLDEAEPEAFIGIPRAHFGRLRYGWARRSCHILLTTGVTFGLGGTRLSALADRRAGAIPVLHETAPDDPAAILFTSGSTGLPKGVLYRHRHFAAQVEMLKQAFGIEPGEIGLSTFPPFALFDPALGLTTVVPAMDPARPGQVDPAVLQRAIDDFKVTNLFVSPEALRRLGSHMEEQRKRLWSIRRVITAGAAVPVRSVRSMEQGLAQDAPIHVSYGATECLPVSSVSNRELDARMEARIESGEGVFVGRPIAPNQVRVVRISDHVLEHLEEATPMPPGMAGEIIVSGPSCTDTYWRRPGDTAMAKLATATGDTWHRMGDVGLLDGQGGLWYCGRVSQRIQTGQETLFADQCEAVFNQHPDVLRSALVGVGPAGRQIPVLCVQPVGKLAPVDRERVHFDLLQLAQAHVLTRSVRSVLFHPDLPVDIRHNSKIDREQLAAWAAKAMQK